MLATLVPLLLAAAAPSAADRSELEKTFVEIFRPYAAPPSGTAAWEFPIYSAEVTALIAQWRQRASADEPDALSDGDWLCQCQEWDDQAFSATIASIGMAGEDLAEVEIAVDLGSGGPESVRAERLVLKREEGDWKIDDLVGESFPQGLKQALRETIAAEGPAAGERG